MVENTDFGHFPDFADKFGTWAAWSDHKLLGDDFGARACCVGPDFDRTFVIFTDFTDFSDQFRQISA